MAESSNSSEKSDVKTGELGHCSLVSTEKNNARSQSSKTVESEHPRRNDKEPRGKDAFQHSHKRGKSGRVRSWNKFSVRNEELSINEDRINFQEGETSTEVPGLNKYKWRGVGKNMDGVRSPVGNGPDSSNGKRKTSNTTHEYRHKYSQQKEVTVHNKTRRRNTDKKLSGSSKPETGNGQQEYQHESAEMETQSKSKDGPKNTDGNLTDSGSQEKSDTQSIHCIKQAANPENRNGNQQPQQGGGARLMESKNKDHLRNSDKTLTGFSFNTKQGNHSSHPLQQTKREIQRNHPQRTRRGKEAQNENKQQRRDIDTKSDERSLSAGGGNQYGHSSPHTAYSRKSKKSNTREHSQQVGGARETQRETEEQVRDINITLDDASCCAKGSEENDHSSQLSYSRKKTAHDHSQHGGSRMKAQTKTKYQMRETEKTMGGSSCHSKDCTHYSRKRQEHQNSKPRWDERGTQNKNKEQLRKNTVYDASAKDDIQSDHSSRETAYSRKRNVHEFSHGQGEGEIQSKNKDQLRKSDQKLGGFSPCAKDDANSKSEPGNITNNNKHENAHQGWLVSEGQSKQKDRSVGNDGTCPNSEHGPRSSRSSRQVANLTSKQKHNQRDNTRVVLSTHAKPVKDIDSKMGDASAHVLDANQTDDSRKPNSRVPHQHNPQRRGSGDSGRYRDQQRNINRDRKGGLPFSIAQSNISEKQTLKNPNSKLQHHSSQNEERTDSYGRYKDAQREVDKISCDTSSGSKIECKTEQNKMHRTNPKNQTEQPGRGIDLHGRSDPTPQYTMRNKRVTHPCTYTTSSLQNADIGKTSGARNCLHHLPDQMETNCQDSLTHPTEPVTGGMTFRNLQQLKQKESSKILYTITNQESGFYTQLLPENIRSDVVELLLAIMAKALYSNKEGSKLYFLNSLKSSDFFTKPFIKYLLNSTGPDTHRNDKCHCAIKNALDILRHLFEARFPGGHIDLVPTITTLQHVLQTNGDVLKDSETDEFLCKALAARDFAREYAAKTAAASRRARNNQDVEPPDYFRDIPILPTVKEIHTKERPFLRANVTEGDYTNLQQYLDIQYRLFREDFVAPLREGISEYILTLQQDGSNARLHDVRLYRDVCLTKRIYQDTSIAHEFKFSLQGLKHISWEKSKRLRPGSLLCLSCDDFKNVYYATVSNQKRESLAEGLVRVCFITDDNSVINIPSNKSFVAVESEAFFPAYYPVLRGLKGIIENEMPFEDYILKCQQKTVTPRYLQRKDQPILYDLTTIAADLDTDGKKHLEAVPILESDKLPKCETLGMDKSQMKAFHAALTNEFALIQGPPGTGKTYVGLKIVKILLHNERVWRDNLIDDESGCILLVCYTNHALDQFLEGIYKFQKEDIARVGSRSNSEILKNYTLETLRRDSICSNVLKEGLRNAGTQVCALQKQLSDSEYCLSNLEKVPQCEKSLIQYIYQSYYNHIVPKRHRIELDDKQIMLKWLLPNSQLEMSGNTSNKEIMGENETTHEGTSKEYLDRDTKRAVKINIARERMSDDNNPLDNVTVEKQINNTKECILHLMKLTGEDEWRQLETKTKTQEHFCHKLNLTCVMSNKEASSVYSVWDIDINDRWRLYRYWITNQWVDLVQQIRLRTEEHQLAAGHLAELEGAQDLEILRKAKVIGITTTGAANRRTMLQQLKPRIIIIEEAAQVLEPHVVTSLTSACQHLILIGDHLQLRPSPVVYRLAKDYKLEISLFERMVGNGIPCQTLRNQFRMRPEISRILRHIYPELHDDISVTHYANIRGISSNVFYINHKDIENSNEEIKSKSNEHEATYITALCRYLVQQGYRQSRITILVPYIGQMLLIKKYMSSDKHLDEVRVCSIDNFQGEENDIILLSLVRSNEQNSIGFLAEVNRVCVALSRARRGFYVIGNFTLLCKKNTLWFKIFQTLKQQKATGESLKLYCQNHPADGVTSVTRAEDFNLAPEGGCQKQCDYRMSCGHVCPKKCHPLDPEHKDIRCRKPCRKIVCSQEHQCLKVCHEICGNCTTRVMRIIPKCRHTQEMACYESPDEYQCQGLCEKVLPCRHPCQTKCCEHPPKKCTVPISYTRPCGHTSEMKCHERGKSCDTQVTKIIPSCGHAEQMACHFDPLAYKCKSPCKSLLPCGHLCTNKCGKPHNEKCLVSINHTKPCGHTANIPCYQRDWACLKLCGALLSCGHLCSGSCEQCFHGRLHMPCTKPCNGSLVCGHLCRARCISDCLPCLQLCGNSCVHGGCTKDCGSPCDLCTQPCPWRCHHYQCTRLCHEPCDRSRCNKPCDKTLSCGHRCMGLCGELCPKICRICDRRKVAKFFRKANKKGLRLIEIEDCGHIFAVSELDHWMDQVEQNENGEKSVQLRTCPICRTPIRRTLRYGTVIKNMLQDMEIVKTRMYADPIQIEKKKLQIQARMNNPRLPQIYNDIVRKSPHLSFGQLVCIENMIGFINVLCVIQNNASDLEDMEETLLRDIRALFVWLGKNRYRVSSQELRDCQKEICRMNLLTKAYLIREKIHNSSSAELQKHEESVDLVIHNLSAGRQIQQDHIETTLNKIKTIIPESDLGASDLESNVIVQTSHLPKGNWFKCLNDHYYMVDDCSHAIQQKCPECQAPSDGKGQ